MFKECGSFKIHPQIEWHPSLRKVQPNSPGLECGPDLVIPFDQWNMTEVMQCDSWGKVLKGHSFCPLSPLVGRALWWQSDRVVRVLRPNPPVGGQKGEPPPQREGFSESTVDRVRGACRDGRHTLRTEPGACWTQTESGVCAFERESRKAEMGPAAENWHPLFGQPSTHGLPVDRRV